MSRAPYLITIGDCAGPFLHVYCESFKAALHVRDLLLAHHPNTRATIVNIDRGDVDSDGLTDEERDEA